MAADQSSRYGEQPRAARGGNSAGSEQPLLTGAQFGEGAKLSAEALREKLLKDRPSGREIALHGKTITGRVELLNALITHPVRFTHCTFTDPIDLTGAQASVAIHLAQCRIQGLSADRLSVDGDLVLEQVCCDGPISLCGAQLSGHLRCTGSTFRLPGDKAVNGRGMVVNGSALFDGDFCCAGSLILASARIDGSIDMTGASLANQGGVALDAQMVNAGEVILAGGFTVKGEICIEGATVKGRVRCNGDFLNPGGVALRANGLDCTDLRLDRGFAAAGQVMLIGARINRELNCTDSKFDNGNGVAIDADGLACDGKVYLNRNFNASGAVQLRNAQIKTELNCTDGTFTSLRAGGMKCGGSVYLNESFRAAVTVELMDATVDRELNCGGGVFGELDAQRLWVGNKFDWRPSRTPDKVDVSFAGVGLLHDEPDSWPAASMGHEWTKLTGFIFTDIADQATQPRDRQKLLRHRIGWLRQSSYAPGVYRQLARIYREKGFTREATEIVLAGQRDLRKRGGMSWAPKLWNWFLDVSVRYGYKMHRPLLIVVLGWLVGIGLFYAGQATHAMEAVGGAHAAAADADKCTPSYPCFFPPIYAFEIFLPVINLRQLNFWLPDTATLWGSFLMMWVWISIAFGWMVTVAVAAGIGNLFSRRD